MLHRQSISKLIQRTALRNRTGLRKRWVAVGVSMFMAWSVPNAIAQHKHCDACQNRPATHGHGSAHCKQCDGGGVSIPSLQTLVIDKLSAAGDRFERNHAAKSTVAKTRTHWHAEPTCAANTSIPHSLRFTKAKEPSCGVEALGSSKQDTCDAKAFWGRKGVGSTGSLSDRQISEQQINGQPSRAIQEKSIAGSNVDSKKPVATQQSSDGRSTVPPDIAAALEGDSYASEATEGSVAPKLIPPPATKSSVPASEELSDAENPSDEPPVPPQVPQTLEAISKSLDEPSGSELKSNQLPSGGSVPPAPIAPSQGTEKKPTDKKPSEIKPPEKKPAPSDSLPPAPMPKPHAEPSESDPLPDILVDPFIEDARSSKPKSTGRVELSSGKGQLRPLTLGNPSQNPINKLRQSDGAISTSLRPGETASLRSGENRSDDADTKTKAPKRLSQSQKDAGERRVGEEGVSLPPTPNTFIPVNGLRSN